MKIRLLYILFILLLFTSCVGTSSQGVLGTGVSVALDPRSLGTQIDDSIMQKNLATKLALREKSYLLSVKVKVINTLPEVHEAEGPRNSTKLSYQSENILDCITIKRPHNAHPLINS